MASHGKGLPIEQAARRFDMFPFLKLPAEIRNEIYVCYLNDGFSGKKYNLAKFPMPAVARANQQLRNEALSVLFADCSFYLDIRSNLCDRHRAREGVLKDHKEVKTRRQKSGVLKMKSQVFAFFKSWPTAVRFRDVTFRVFEAEARNPVYDVDLVLSMKMRWRSNGAGLEVEASPKKHVNLGIGFDDADIEEPTNEAKAFMRKVSGSKDFRGFTLQQLKIIASNFRFEPGMHKDEKMSKVFERCLQRRNGPRRTLGNQAVRRKK